MVRRARWGLTIVLLLGFCVAAQAQAQESYLDEYVVHVKPEKRAAFDSLVKKLVAANREHQGDTWVALETLYGESNTIRLISIRPSYAEIEKATGAFMGAVEKAMGDPGTEKLFEDLAECNNGSQGLLLRRRPDLSVNLPSDPAEQSKLVGNARWVRLIRIVVRIGQGPRFEELAKQVKAAEEKANPNTRSWISQSVAGERASVYYVAELQSSLAGFDGAPTLPQMMGNDAYQNLLKTASEVIQTEDVTLNQFVPALSNPPADTLNAAPDFWRPKPAAPKTAAAKPAAGKAPAKKEP
jgi:hypothetical protein